MAVWIFATVIAAFFQNLRNVLQKHVAVELSATGATFSRFLYSLPIVLLFLFAVMASQKATLPALNVTTFGFAFVGGLAQIAANLLLVMSYRLRNFAVATTFSKTEVAQSALMSAIMLREPPHWLAGLGIVISFFGISMLSAARSALSWRIFLTSLKEKPALFGLASGAGFAFSAVCYRAGTLSLATGSPLLRATYFLAIVIVLQIAVFVAYLAAKDKALLFSVLTKAKSAGWIGATGAVSSLAWFFAMAVQNVAYVRAVGQIELLFAFAASHLLFKERSKKLEILGMCTMTAGILLVLLSTS